MPQMAPINWLTLFFFIFIIFIMFNIMNYFSLNMMNNKLMMINLMKKNKMMNWKW